jgi:serine phosphatase RsbU (regulator of sigma subunit)/anti-sigma regulatory factor (Ser/Thr protein kinase)
VDRELDPAAAILARALADHEESGLRPAAPVQGTLLQPLVEVAEAGFILRLAGNTWTHGMSFPRGTHRKTSSSGPTNAFDEYGSSAARFRRNLILAAVLAVVAVAAVSAGLALRQYRHAQHAARDDMRTRAIVAAGVINAAFAGDVSTLSAVALAPSFADGRIPLMAEYVKRINKQDGRIFNGGIGWIDRSGIVRVSTERLRTPAPSVADRAYFRRVVATGAPYVSGGLIGRSYGEPVVVVAVPTFDRAGKVSGVLAGSVKLASVSTKRAALDLGYEGFEIVDRNGKKLLSGLTPVRNPALLAWMRATPSGVRSGTHGLDGDGNDVVAAALAKVPNWWIVIDRPSASVDAAARHSLVLQIASVGAVALVMFAIVAFVIWRSLREHRMGERRARAWSDLARTLSAASSSADVNAAVTASLLEAFPGSMAVVVLDGVDGTRDVHVSNPGSWRLVAQNQRFMDAIANRVAEQPGGSVSLETVPELAGVVRATGLRLRRLHSLPMIAADREVIGGVGLLRRSDSPLDADEWASFGSFVAQAAQAFDRSRRWSHDHRVAIRLQRSLLPEALPDVESVSLAGHYQAGSQGLEVGGDWYDALRRRDGIVLLCVGDVIGRGMASAMLMGRLRDAFRAHGYESPSPAEIVRRLRQHVMDEDMMTTLACIALDPYSGTIAYSCAGHPPPLLVDAGGRVSRLDDAGAPPLGVADAASIREADRAIAEPSTLVLYSDGLVERRGRNIDEGIDALGESVARDPARPVADAIADVAAVLGPDSDDVALLVARATGVPHRFDVELRSDARELSQLRRRLRSWLARRSVEAGETDEIVLAVSEACNNAIEHGYAGSAGPVFVRVVDDGEVVRVTVLDRGRWRTEPSGEDRGRGLAIMEAVMDVADITSNGEGTQVVLERRRAVR